MENKGSVLLVSYYFPPMGMGGVQRPLKLAKYLCELGWSVKILTVKDVHYHEYDHTLLEEINTGDVHRSGSLDPARLKKIFRAGSHIQKVQNSSDDLHNQGPVSNEGNNQQIRDKSSFLRKILKPDSKVLWIPSAYRKAKWILRKYKIKTVITTGPPFSSHLLGLLLKQKKNVKWIADFRDGWSVNDFSKMDDSFPSSFDKNLERRILELADKVTVVTKKIYDHTCSVIGSDEKVQLIYNGFDPEDFIAEDSNSDSSDQGDGRTFNITFVGSVTKYCNPVVFFRAVDEFIQSLKDSAFEIRINIVGKNLIGDLGTGVLSENFHNCLNVTGYVPHKEAVSSLRASNILLFSLGSESGENMLTGKLFEYMAASPNLLANVPDGEVKDFINCNFENPFFYADDDVGVFEYLSAVYGKWKSNDKTKEMIDLTKVNINYNRRYQAEQFSKIISDLNGVETDGKL